MANKPSLTQEQQLALWRMARRRLMSKKPPAVSPALAQRLLHQLPARQSDESLGDWLRRSAEQPQTTAEIRPFPSGTARRFQPLSEFTRLAADSATDELELPAVSELQSSDGRFRLRIEVAAGSIELTLEALGLAADELAHCRIGLLGPSDHEEPLLTLTLDQDSDGRIRTEDNPTLRRALLNPRLVLIE